MSDVTLLLDAIQSDDPEASAQLLPIVYEELRRLAARRLAHEAPGQTLDATALVHEAYLRLVGDKAGARWDSRGHFFAAAAEAMRRILVEQARRKRRLRHGGARKRVRLDSLDVPASVAADGADLLAVDEALTEFAREEPEKAELVKLRFFGGLSVAEAASCLGIARATADRHWAYARAWLFDRLRDKS